LPHIAPREPSAFHIIMRSGACRPFVSTMSPSAPMPKCRSDHDRASSAARSSGKRSRSAST
jgi:hypothetical protein